MRRTVIYHCFNLVAEQVYQKRELAEVMHLFYVLETIADWERIIKKSTRCRFIYWIRALCPHILDMIMRDAKRPNQINYFLMALNDPISMLWNVKHLSQPNVAVDNYKKEIFKAFTDKVVKPICTKIEEEVRLQIH